MGTGATVRLPPVIGHRGAAAYAPENTIAGFRMAAERGAPWVELDTRLTADGTCVVFHDDDLGRITGRTGRVEELPLRLVTALDAGRWFDPVFAGVRIPTLGEALGAIAEAGLGVNVEIKPARGKAAALVRAVAAAVAAAWPADGRPLLVSSVDPEVVEAAQGLLASRPRGLVVRRLAADWRERALGLGCLSIHHHAANLSRATVVRIKEAGFQLGAWTVNDAERAAELWDWGVDAVFTDVPDVMVAAWRQRR